MIAHVAEAGEARGRVILRISEASPSPIALRAAVHIARAYDSEIEGLFVCDEQVFDMAGFAFTQVVSPSGRVARHMDQRDIARAYSGIERSVAARLQALAGASDVPCRCRSVRDEPLRALTAACAERGPWNVVTFAEAFDSRGYDELAGVFESVRDVTALVIVGARARLVEGPVVIVLDEAAALTNAIRTARRIAAISESDIEVLIAGNRDGAIDDLDGDARLALADGDDSPVRILRGDGLHGEPAAIAEAVRRLAPGFVIARFKSVFAADRLALRVVLSALECPLLLTR